MIDGQRICPSAEIVYCWQVSAVETGYALSYYTGPDEQTFELEPGTGIARFHYAHHGTANEVEAKLVSYAMAKAAVAQLTHTLATEVARNGVRVNAVAPGFVISGMTGRHFTNADGTVDEAKKAEVSEFMGSVAPLGRVGQPDDIAAAVLYLASDASSFMTGQILRPNGGVSMPW